MNKCKFSRSNEKRDLFRDRTLVAHSEETFTRLVSDFWTVYERADVYKYINKCGDD